MEKDWEKIRSLIGFWIIGLCNNYAYVIMLSAAEDIVSEQEHTNGTKIEKNCEDKIITRHCTSLSTGTVLLADVIPTLIVKLTFPFFMQRIPFGVRHLIICSAQAASFLVVAFSVNIPMSLVGVVIASFGSGLGEITFLSLTPFFGHNTISTWSSGTGGAGVIGALSYAALTEPKLAHLSPKTTLLIMLIVPTIFAATYWCLLNIPKSVYQVKMFDPRTWIVPTSHLIRRKSTTLSSSSGRRATAAISDVSTSDDVAWKTEKSLEMGSHKSTTTTTTTTAAAAAADETTTSEKTFENDEEMRKRGYTDAIRDGTIKQRPLTATQKVFIIIPLLKYMIPLTLVYLGEYLINQGFVQLIIFNCAKSFGLSRPSQYRWYQVIYQTGVFISRSSINIIRLPHFVLILLAIFQLMNAVVFFLDAIYFYIPHIGIVFALILFEGLFGGSSYVNTFDHIHNFAAPDVREYSLSVGSLGDSIGIVTAGFLAIPLHNYVCTTPLPMPNA